MTQANISTPAHFLLVDDLDENLLALEGLLRREGLVLLKARSGAEALELLLVHEVALALVDVQMPGMDGFELAELMRGTERTRRVPIIFLTAGADDYQRLFRGYEAGAVDFLKKPIEPHVLRSKAGVFLELWLERQEVARQRDELKIATAENARLLEETRQTAEALREADRRKNEFLATLAHELRNPLAPIGNGLQVMKVATGNPEAIIKAREMMERQLGHMVRLVDDLLDMSRITSGKVRLQLQSMDIKEAIETAVEATKPFIEAGNHSLSVELPDVPMMLNADPTRLSQIIGNLLTNAAKYTSHGGRISVNVTREDNTATIRVTDNGVGIPKDMLPKIFGLFTQVGHSLERSQGGLGIGLSLVKKLVELHGGDVTAESPGAHQGSTFIIRLPLDKLHEEVAVKTPATPTKPAVGNSRRILVVDDNLDSAETLSLLLTFLGNKTEKAYTGTGALRAVAEFDPELVFLDIGLPEMNGYEVAQKLRADPRNNDLILVAVTGWGTDEDRQRSKEAGFNFHLTKPVAIAKLSEIFTKLNPPVAS